MRKLTLAAFALTIAGSVLGQGTVVFSSYNSLGTVHYWGANTYVSFQGNGTTDIPAGTIDYAAAGMQMIGSTGLYGRYGAETTFAQLLYANGASQPANSLVPGGQTTSFRTGNTVGRISMITDTIAGLTPDSAAATFAMVAWDNSSGQYSDWTTASRAWMAGKIAAGESPAFTVSAIGGTANVPPVMLPPSFNLIPTPEPSAAALALLGVGCLFFFRHRKLIVAAFALTVAGSVFAQGTVLFSSYNSLGTVHYWGPSTSAPYLYLQGNGPTDTPVGSTDYAHYGMVMIGAPDGLGAATTFAQLLWANGANQPMDSLVPGGQTTTFRTGNTAGRISVITDTIIGLTPDSAAATFAMVAWDNSSGQYPTWTQASAAWWAGKIAAGGSTAFNVYNIGGTANSPPFTLPPSFNVLPWPEPSTGALTLLGLGCLFFRRRKLLVAAFALTVAGSVFAQGTVLFSSYNSLGTVHFWGPSTSNSGLSLIGNSAADTPAGTTDYAGSGMAMIGSSGLGGPFGAATTFAQLLWANGASQPYERLRPGGQTTSFRTGNTVGRITTITDTINGLTPDSAAATFAMVMWDNSSGQYPTWTQASPAWLSGKLLGAGVSEEFTVQNIGGTANVPPIAFPPGFNIYWIPEPAAGAVACLGLAYVLLFRRRR